MTNRDEHSAACARVCARLPALIDGALAALDEARDRGHLEACAPCREALARHAHLLASIRAASVLGVADDAARVASAVLARLGPPPARSARGRESVLGRARAPRRWLVGLAAAAAAVLGLALLDSRAGASPGAGPRAALEQVLVELPSWSDVVRGLGGLSRTLS